MSHAENKVDWCLKKAERELSNSGKHKGLVRVSPNLEEVRKHIEKAEHYLEATDLLKKENFSDICASTLFYSMYHCLLAIASKFGYESGNQECTFALIHSLIEEGKIDFEEELLNKIALPLVEKSNDKLSMNIREQYQYGTELSLGEDFYEELFELSKKVIAKSKEVIEHG